MKIAVNTRLLLKDKLEGIGRFTYETLVRMTKNHPNDEFYFLFDRKYDPSFVFGPNVHPIVIGPQARHPILYNIWFDYSVKKALKKIKPDVFLSPDGYLSLTTQFPQIAVIHDLNFEHYPEDLPKNALKYYRTKFPKFARKAERIITVSEFSKQDIIQQYGIDASKIDVTYNGVSDMFQPTGSDVQETIKQQYSNEQNYFIYVGSLHARKNIDRMFRAFDEFKKTTGSGNKLMVVGEKIWNSVDLETTLNQLQYKNDIIFTGRVSNEEMVKLIGASSGLVYVSYFEGFGIPIIEGMKCGVPVLTSNVTSMPEVAGNAAILVDPFSVESIAVGMKQLTDKTSTEELVIKGFERANQFNWDNTAEKVWECIERVSKRP